MSHAQRTPSLPPTAPRQVEAGDPTRLPECPRVSILMLAYRHEQFLPQAIESVLSQDTRHAFELLVGEDCSPDGTREVALDYQRRHPDRIRVIYADRNVGAFENSRRLIEAARGEYIAFCEGDDYWTSPHKLERQVDLLDANPGASVCFTDFDRVLGVRIRRAVYHHRPPRHLPVGDAYHNLLRGWSVMTATSMYRGEVLRAFVTSEFNRRDFPFGDYNKLLFAAQRGTFLYIPESMAAWRKVVGSASNSGFDARLRLMTGALACRELFMDRFPVPEPVRQEALQLAHRDIATAAFHAGNAAQYHAAVEAARALGHAPPVLRHAIRRACLALGFPISLVQAFKLGVLLLGAHAPLRLLKRSGD